MDKLTLTGVDELPERTTTITGVRRRVPKKEDYLPYIDSTKLNGEVVVILGHAYAKERGRLNPKTNRIYTPSTTVRYQKSVMRACYDCRLRLEPEVEYLFDCEIYITGRHGDITNIVKAVEDGINLYAERMGIKWDDKQIKQIHTGLYEVKHKDEEKVVFILRPLADWVLAESKTE